MTPRAPGRPKRSRLPMPLKRLYRVLMGHESIAHQELWEIGDDRPVDRASTYPFRIKFGLPGAYEDGFGDSKGDIVIGNDVYIGRGVRISSGVTVGHGAVLGSYAVVTKDVRPYAIMGGNPAREIRRRFGDEQVDQLLRVRWWDWPDEDLAEAVALLNDRPVDEFLASPRAQAALAAAG
jgi:hypothetical protein